MSGVKNTLRLVYYSVLLYTSVVSYGHLYSVRMRPYQLCVIWNHRQKNRIRCTYNNSRQTIIEKTSAMAVRLMDGFKRVRDAWPVVESRAGRDLGEYIKVGLMLSTRCIM